MGKTTAPFDERIGEEIKGIFDFPFKVKNDGFYFIEATARCKNKKQNTLPPFLWSLPLPNIILSFFSKHDDDDLYVKIDGREFPKLSGKKGLTNSPAAWSGAGLRNLAQTNTFILRLSSGDHNLHFVSDERPIVEHLRCVPIPNPQDFAFSPKYNNPAEDGDRRPWYTFVLVDLPLASVTVSVSCQRRFQDRDDLKIIIDGKIKRNLRSGFWKFWWWVGSWLRGETQTDGFELNLLTGLHYIEFHADRMPTLKGIEFDFGVIPEPQKRIPTVDDPNWTGQFRDDPEEILLARLIFGEARDQPQEAKVWVAWSVINRIEASAWPNNIHDVILQEDQYDPIKPADRNYPYVINPLRDNTPSDLEKWRESYAIAEKVIQREIENPTQGATHFHGVGVDREWFEENIVPNGRFLKKIGDTSFYWSPN